MSISLIDLLNVPTQADMVLRQAGRRHTAASRRPRFVMRPPASWPRRTHMTTVDHTDGAWVFLLYHKDEEGWCLTNHGKRLFCPEGLLP
jgi:hypothetical protein